MKKLSNIKKYNFDIEKPIKVKIKNINIEIFKGINENGKPIIQKLKPAEILKKRLIALNGVSFDKIQEAVRIIQNEEKRLNTLEHFKDFDRKLMGLREKLNYRKETYKWYHNILKFISYKID